MEKHTMQDGPIPLFGSLPSAVSRQWGITLGVRARSYVQLPISATPLVVVATDINLTSNPLALSTGVYQLGSFMLDGRRLSADDGQLWARWIAICSK